MSNRDLVMASLEQLHCGPQEAEPDPDADSGGQRPAKKRRRDAQSIKDRLGDKTRQVLFLLENRLAASRTNAAVIGAAQLIRDLQHSCSSTDQGLEPLGPRRGLSAAEPQRARVPPKRGVEHGRRRQPYRARGSTNTRAAAAAPEQAAAPGW